MKNLTPQRVRQILGAYYDIPQMIAEEVSTIAYCEKMKRSQEISLRSQELCAAPGAHAAPGDPTYREAVRDADAYYTETIARCREKIAELRAQRLWTLEALKTLNRVDRIILDMLLLGPADPQSRNGWRPATWNEIAQTVSYSNTQCRNRYAAAVNRLALFSA